MYIDGQWTEARSGATFEVTNPATGEVIGTVPDGGADDARDAGDTCRRPTAHRRFLHQERDRVRRDGERL